MGPNLQNCRDQTKEEHDAPPGHSVRAHSGSLRLIVLVGQAHKICHQYAHADECLQTIQNASHPAFNSSTLLHYCSVSNAGMIHSMAQSLTRGKSRPD